MTEVQVPRSVLVELLVELACRDAACATNVHAPAGDRPLHLCAGVSHQYVATSGHNCKAFRAFFRFLEHDHK